MDFLTLLNLDTIFDAYLSADYDFKGRFILHNQALMTGSLFRNHDLLM